MKITDFMLSGKNMYIYIQLLYNQIAHGNIK